MAEECFRWASEAYTDQARQSYLQLAQIWLDTTSKLDGLPPTRTQSAPHVEKWRGFRRQEGGPEQ
jgi:hypothetical protein